ncbi:MAG: hypothetical protein R2702_12605 [Acidimicrobiales bacterium]
MIERRRRHGDGRVAIATLAVLVLHLWLTARVPWPTVVFDENGYLGSARHLAGGARGEMPHAPAYASGYPLLLAPLSAVGHDPDHLWRAIQVLNAVLVASLVPILHCVARRVLGLAPRRALAAATVGALAPAALAASSSAVAEVLVLPVVPAAALALWAMLDDARPTRHRLAFGPILAVLAATHPRFTSGLALGLALLAAWAWRTPAGRRVAGANALGLATVALVLRAVDRSVRAARWSSVERLEGDPATWWHLVTSFDGLRELTTTAIGQAWYLAAGSLGLVVVGLVGALALLRRPDALAELPAAATVEARRRIVVGFVLALAAAVFATSVLFFAQNQFRADHFAYGRHNDSFTPLWATIGVGALVAGSVRLRRAATILAAIAIGLTGALLSVLRDPTDLGSTFSPFAVPAAIRFAEPGPSGTFERGTLVAGGVALALVTGQHLRGRARRPVAALAVLVVAGWSVWSGLGAVEGTARFGRIVYADWDPVPTIERLGVDELCIDASAVRARANLTYAWYLPDVDVRSYDAAAGEQPPCPFSLARLDDPARPRAGDRAALLDQGIVYADWGAPQGLALWVAPGTEQERLAARGALLPEGYPTALPADAQRGTIRRDGPALVRTAPGGRVRMEVEVVHAGTGAPWPDRESSALPGHVRIVAEITPLDPDGVPGARSGGELPRWMLPGDRATTAIEVVAVGRFLEPLPPGRYHVQLGVAQEGQEWVASGGPGGAFDLEVVE